VPTHKIVGRGWGANPLPPVHGSELAVPAQASAKISAMDVITTRVILVATTIVVVRTTMIIVIPTG
jgi:hypothetical protein